ncbi:hypothetical protein [Streptomyces sp. MK7]|uniref:hypothetical protein n=1 Tax=Streptomyces sp. MK7 TaxID=3067635 RepID=UPI00292D4CBC|nr:hypothetical protein [Streptomyces sp. MK7]
MSALGATALAAVAALAGSVLHDARPVGAVVAAAPAASGVEDDGADCPVPGTGSTPSGSLLPDPFTELDGTLTCTSP